MKGKSHGDDCNGEYHGIIVTQKYLTSLYYCNTVIGMANVLPEDKQIAVIGALAEDAVKTAIMQELRNLEPTQES